MSVESSEKDEERSRRKHIAKIHNDRLKLVADVIKGVLLLALGLGFFRFLFDPGGGPVGVVQSVLVLSGSSLLFGLIWLLLEYQKPEE